MKIQNNLVVVLGLFSLFSMMIHNGHAYQFNVEWSLASSSSYDQWAQRSRFQIGDTLLFNYQANEDSVLQVSESDYMNCSTASPIANYSDGHTAIKLNESGPHYFISGVVEHCKNNEKLMIVVLADRSNRSNSDTPAAAPSPAPAAEEFPSPPPAPGTPDIDQTPAAAPTEEKPSPPTPNGASAIFRNFLCSVGAVCFSLFFSF